MPSESEKIIAQMKSLIAESKRLHQRHSEIVLQFQKLHEKLERLQQEEKRRVARAALGAPEKLPHQKRVARFIWRKIPIALTIRSMSALA